MNILRVGVVVRGSCSSMVGRGGVEHLVTGCGLMAGMEGTGPCHGVTGAARRCQSYPGLLGQRFGRRRPKGILLASVACLCFKGKRGTCLSYMGSKTAGRVITCRLSASLRVSVMCGALGGLGRTINSRFRPRTVLRSSRNFRCARPRFRDGMGRLNLVRSVSQGMGY